MIESLNYPTGPLITVPDRLGRTDSGKWVLWEEKTKDNVDWALRQLSDGLRNLRALDHPVNMLGIALEKFDPKEGWTADRTGLLVRRPQLGPAPYEISSIRVLVETRSR